MYTPQKLWNKYLIMFIFISFTISVTMQFYNATLALYVDHLHGNTTTVGSILMVFTISAIAGRMLSGNIIDKVGRRVIAYIGLLIFACATAMYIFLPFIAVIFVLRSLQGIGFAISNTAAATAAADVIPKERMGEGMGYHGLSTALSGAVGPAIGLAFVAGGNFNGIFIFGTLSLILGMIVLYFAKYEEKSCLQQLKDAKKSKATRPKNTETKGLERYIEKKALPASLVQFIYGFAMGFVFNFLTLYAQKNGITNAGLFFTLTAVAMVGSRLSISRLSDKLAGIYIVLPSCICGAAAFILMLMAPNEQTLILISGILYGIATGSIMPLLQAEAVKHVSADRRGVASANYLVAMDGGIGVGGFLWGIIIDLTGGFTEVILGSALCIIISAAIFICLIAPKQRKAKG